MTNIDSSIEQNPHMGNDLEAYLNAISQDIEKELAKEGKDFEKLRTMIYKVIMMLMRQTAKTDQEFVSELNVNIKAQSHKIRDTYNTWPGVAITVVSASISIFGGCAGLTPLFPTSVVSPEIARTLAGSSQAIGTAGTGLGGVGSIFNNRSEATRGVLQQEQRRDQEKMEDRKNAKHTNQDNKKTARAAVDDLQRIIHDTVKAMTGG